MKIAVILTGQPRSFEGVTHTSILNKIINKYNCDVYAHCWWSKEDIGTIYSKSPWCLSKDLIVKENIDIRIQELYNFKKIVFDRSTNLLTRDNTFDRIKHIYNVNSYLCQFYSIRQAYGLIDDPNQYDFIIKLRYDLEIKVFPDLELLDENKSYYQHYNDTFSSDMLWIQSRKHYDLFCVYDNIIDTYLLMCKIGLQECTPERVIYFYFMDKKGEKVALMPDKLLFEKCNV